MATTPDPKNVTIRGRLSFPRFKHAEAVAFAANSQFDKNKPADQIASSFTLLLEPDQRDKLLKHIADVYLPYAAEQHKNGEKRDGQLDPKLISKIEKSSEEILDSSPDGLVALKKAGVTKAVIAAVSRRVEARQ